MSPTPLSRSVRYEIRTIGNDYIYEPRKRFHVIEKIPTRRNERRLESI